jgi:hypothetical protein
MGSILTLTCGHAALYPRGCRTEWEMENRRFVSVAPLQEARLTSAVRFACGEAAPTQRSTRAGIAPNEMENRRFVSVAPLQEARLTSAVRFACGETTPTQRSTS